MTRSRRLRRFALSSPLAIAAGLVAGPGQVAQAQSFDATSTVVAGSASVITNPGTTDIFVDSTSAVINWVPNDTATGGGPINFQPAATTATFVSFQSEPADYYVLNRILPTDSTRAVQFNGTVISQSGIGEGQLVPGGTVFFYSPGGIILGPTSIFDVGSLGLTTSSVPFNGATGDFLNLPSRMATFPTANSGTSVVVSPGASVTAHGPQAFLAMVAPSVSNAGSISVDGSAALVSADAASITFSPDGLFDIQVTSGTSATGTTLLNSGTITGSAGAGLADSHRIYMVAVPKNDAITMAISNGSQLGFAIAGAADTDGNVIVLSGGHDIADGVISAPRSDGGGAGTVDIVTSGNNLDFTSYFESRATGSNQFTVSAGTANFASDALFFNGGTSFLNVAAAAAGTLNVAGSLIANGGVVAFGEGESVAAGDRIGSQ